MRKLGPLTKIENHSVAKIYYVKNGKKEEKSPSKSSASYRSKS